MMKKVIRNEELYTKMHEAINILCDTVKSTLGPKGSNAIIDHSTFTPFITNDGVTIAENICSDDATINTILELAKEASIKTNDKVGDGTTTTLVFLQSIFNQGIEYIRQGLNPMVLKEELHKSLETVLKKIDDMQKIPSAKELQDIAIISSNNKEIGQIISEVYLKILNKSAIEIIETEEEITSVNYYQGYTLDCELASPYFLTNDNDISLDNAKILLVNNHLEDIESLSEIINELLISKNKQPLIILANSYNNYLVEEILNINRENNLDIYLFTNDIYAMRRTSILQDLEAISGGKIISNLDNISYTDLGNVTNAIINREKIVIKFKFNNNIKNRILALNEDIKNNTSDKEFVEKRLTMINKGSAVIKVGAYTKTERREMKMRFDDALWAISEASKGVVVGGGMCATLISEDLEEASLGNKLLKKAMLEPMKTILNNAGLNYEEIYHKIKSSKEKIIFNVQNNNYENITTTVVLDPASVIKEALINATSIASMLLTTTSLMINEYQNNLHNNELYNTDEL